MFENSKLINMKNLRLQKIIKNSKITCFDVKIFQKFYFENPSIFTKLNCKIKKKILLSNRFFNLRNQGRKYSQFVTAIHNLIKKK